MDPSGRNAFAVMLDNSNAITPNNIIAIPAEIHFACQAAISTVLVQSAQGWASWNAWSGVNMT